MEAGTIQGVTIGIGQRSLQVDSQMIHLEKSIDELWGNVEAIHNRLEVVLRSPDSEKSNKQIETAPPDEILVAHADAIRISRRKISDINNRLLSLISRLEI
jgi:hypothetical protein